MKKLKKSQAPLRVEFSGSLLHSIAGITHSIAEFVQALLLSLMEIILALKDAAIKRIRQ